MAYTIVLDPGHGGSDPGAVFEGRQEKDDSLRLAMAIGDILRNNGYNVVFTRTTDVYNTPFEKATIGNENYADLFVSIHRNSAPEANMYSGIQTLLYNDSGIKAELARNINRNLVELGFQDKGVVERPNLVVLKRTKMPAVLIEAGFINSLEDNQIFDEQFNEVAQAIADGIMETVENTTPASVSYEDAVKVSTDIRGDRRMRAITDAPMFTMQPEIPQDDSSVMPQDMRQGTMTFEMEPNTMPPGMPPNRPPVNPPRPPQINQPRPPEMAGNRRNYKVQVGAYRNQFLANNLVNQLISIGYPVKVVYENDLFKVQVGDFERLDNAVMMERRLREDGFNTFIVGPRR